MLPSIQLTNVSINNNSVLAVENLEASLNLGKPLTLRQPNQRVKQRCLYYPLVSPNVANGMDSSANLAMKKKVSICKHICLDFALSA